MLVIFLRAFGFPTVGDRRDLGNERLRQLDAKLARTVWGMS